VDRRAPLPDPYASSSRPYTRWWWFASEIQEADVRAELDWLKANGFGGVEIAWVYPLNIERYYARFYSEVEGVDPSRRTPRQEWLSPEWSRIVAYAKRYADEIGLGCDFTFGTAWPFGDTRVGPEDFTRVFGRPDFTQKNLISWESPELGNTIDHLDRGAFRRYAERMGGALRPAMAGSPSGVFCDSWEVETKGIWTDGFGDAFRERYGYDLEPWMDRIYEPERADERYDYMKLVAEYVLEEFLRPFHETSRELGGFSRVQCCGAPTDLLAAYATVDVPETEAMLYEPGFARIAASAAALTGRRAVTCETFTCLYGWPREHIREEQTADLKLVADAVLGNGVNQIIWHGKPFNRRGRDDVSFYASVHVGPTGRLAHELPAFNRYLAEVSSAMKRGRTYADVAVYLPQEDAWIAGVYPEELQLPWAWGAYELRYVRPPEEVRGHHPLWINGRFLAEGRLDGRVLTVGDARFTSLYVDVEYLDREALETILRLAEGGFPICLKRNPKEPGRRKSKAYGETVAKLRRLPNVSSEFERTAVQPPLVESDAALDFWCRVDGNVHWIFFPHPKAKDLRYPLAYGQSRTTETIERDVTLHVAGRAAKVRLRFEPYRSVLLRVGSDGLPEPVELVFIPEIPTADGGD